MAQENSEHSLGQAATAGSAFRLLSSPRKAQALFACYRKALDADPGNREVRHTVGELLRALQQIHKPYLSQYSHWLEETTGYYEDMLSIDPDWVEGLRELAHLYQLQNQHQQAIRCYEAVLQQHPFDLAATLKNALAFPLIYDSTDALDSFKRRYADQLHKILGQLDLLAEQATRETIDALEFRNFHFAYQCDNDRELQERYGAIIHRLVTTAHPCYDQRPSSSGVGRIRVGYVSCFFYRHSNFRTRAGWAIKLPSDQFETHVYHCGKPFDNYTKQLVDSVDHFYHTYGKETDAIAQQILADDLDVLVYVGLGMESVTLRLACFRLAPTQCASWGHPITSGLPTIDYFISSSLMEPSRGQDHYTEKLVVLSNLGIAYPAPNTDIRFLSASDLGLPSDKTILLCSQSLWKLLPQYDDIFARLSATLPECLIVFINTSNVPVGRDFLRRLSTTYSQYGLNVDQHCQLLDRLNGAEFLSLNRCSTVFLDTFGWSGCNTALDAVSVGLPIVTCPGEYMRGRHALAILQMLGLEECIAASTEHYIQIVHRLARDHEFQQSVIRKIKARRHLLFDDEQCIADLARFYRSVAYRTNTDDGQRAV